MLVMTVFGKSRDVFFEIRVTEKAMASSSFRDVIAFFSYINFNKSMLQILHPNAPYPLAFVFIGERCRLCEFIRFLWSDHVTHQIRS